MRKVAFIVILCGLLLSSLSLVCSACSPYYIADPQYLAGRTVRGVVWAPQVPSGGYAYQSSTDPSNPIPIALNTNRVFRVYFTDVTGKVMDGEIYDYDSRAGDTTNDKLETRWDFGDGTAPVVSKGNSPSTGHTFTTPGLKTLTWYVRDCAQGGIPAANDAPALDKPGDVPAEWDTGGKLYVFVDTWTAPAYVILVSPKGNNTTGRGNWYYAKKSIKDAIAMASEGNEIWVAGGLYYEWDIHLKSGVPLYGGFAGVEGLRDTAKYPSVIDARDAVDDPIVSADGIGTGEKKIDGFTLQRCAHDGIEVENPIWELNEGRVVSPVVISTNIIKQNYIGVYCSWADSVQIIGNQIDSNATGIWFSDTGASIIGNRITNNGSTEVYSAGIRGFFSGVDIRNNFIERNYPHGIGMMDSSGLISNNVIRDNTGSGVYLDYSKSFEISNNTITGNHADYYDAAIGGRGGDLTVTNNIIAFNTSSLPVEDNPQVAVQDMNLALLNNCFYQRGASPVRIPEGAIGSVVADPLLASDGVHIQSNSPCVNKGSGEVTPVEFDIDSQGRRNGIIDIGADESYGARWYDLTLNSEKTSILRGNSAVVYATVTNGGTPVVGCRVNFSVSGGIISNSQPVTNNAWVQAISNSVGKMIVTASIAAPGSAIGERIEKSVNIWVYDPATEVWPTLHGKVERQNAGGSLPMSSISSWQPPRLMMTIPSDNEGLVSAQWSSPVVAYGKIYLAANDEEGTLYSIGQDGYGLSSTKLLSRIFGTPSVKYGSIFVGTDDGLACALDAASFNLQWVAEGDGGTLYSAPAVEGDEIVFFRGYSMTSYGYIFDLDTAAHKDWSPITSNCFFGHGLAPAISGDRLYLQCAAFNIETGQGLWEAGDTLRCTTTPVAYTYNGKKYIFYGVTNTDRNFGYLARVLDNGSSYDYNPYCPSPEYNVYVGAGKVVATPAVYNGRAYAASTDGYVRCINAVTSSMTEIWSVNLGARISSAPVISSSSGLVVATEDGIVYVLNAADGIVKRQFSIGGKITASPAIANGKIYVVSDTVVSDEVSERKLYCIGQ